MKISKSLLATAALIASIGSSISASAQVIGSQGGGLGPFLGLSTSVPGTTPASNCGVATCTLGSIGTIVGGQILTGQSFSADIPANIFGSQFLAAGPTASQPSILTFSGAGQSYISFLWGSPDLYNRLTVVSTGGSQVFTANTSGVGLNNLGFTTFNGDQDQSRYVQFFANPGVMITQLIFDNNPSQNAFEVANFSNTRPVPEPSSLLLVAAGLSALAFVGLRRKQA